MDRNEPTNPHRNIAQKATVRFPLYPLGTDSLRAVLMPGNAKTQAKVKPVIKNLYSPKVAGLIVFANIYTIINPNNDATICVIVNQEAPCIRYTMSVLV